MISEASKFVNAFGTQSVPQIYLSALPFPPPESAILRRVWAVFQNILSVEAGRSEVWPVIRRTFTGHFDSAAFSPDSSCVVSGSYDRTARTRDTVSGTPLKSLRGYLESVSFVPDDNSIISGSHDQTIRIWDAALGTVMIKPLQGHSSWAVSVAYSPDGTRIVSGSDDKTVRIWA